MLTLYRRAIAFRWQLIATLPDDAPALRVVESSPQVLHLLRGDSWHCVTNFGDQPVPLPAGTLVASSIDLIGGLLPGDATAWVLSAEPAPPR